MITIEKIKEHNVAHIEANGYKSSVMYDPTTMPLSPFLSLSELQAFAEKIEKEMMSKPSAPEEVAVPEEIPTERREWRPDLFWRRFTSEEQIKLVSAAKDDPAIETFRMHLMMTPIVTSDDDVTKNGMAYLVAWGLLTEKRKNEILGGD